ncbi:MAG TPA: hypothetical protein VM223_15435 [Planctomycetota bacterium]|nr:hypothetical protein [Planctomycetota bacterium]
MINSKELMDAPVLVPPTGAGESDAAPTTSGVRESAGCAVPGSGDVLAIPFADSTTRFWEKTVAFSAINLLGTAGAAWVVYRGWHTPSILAAALACGVTAGVAVGRGLPAARLRQAGRNSQRSGRPMRQFRCVGAATVVSLVLLAFLLEIGRIALIFPGWVQSIAVAAVSCFVAYCTACFVAPMAAAFNPRQWPAAGSRLALNWHRALGTLVLTAAYLLTVVPAGLLVAPAPKFALARLARIARVPLWSWLMPLCEVGRMTVSLLGAEPAAGSLRTAWTILAAAVRRIVTIPLVILGMVYALLITAAHVLVRLSCQVTADERPAMNC